MNDLLLCVNYLSTPKMKKKMESGPVETSESWQNHIVPKQNEQLSQAYYLEATFSVPRSNYMDILALGWI